MVDVNDIIISIIGFFAAFYGGLTNDLLTITIGLLTILLSITLKLQSQEDDIKILKAQINTQNELTKIREELKEIKNAINKKQ